MEKDKNPIILGIHDL